MKIRPPTPPGSIKSKGFNDFTNWAFTSNQAFRIILTIALWWPVIVFIPMGALLLFYKMWFPGILFLLIGGIMFRHNRRFKPLMKEEGNMNLANISKKEDIETYEKRQKKWEGLK